MHPATITSLTLPLFSSSSVESSPDTILPARVARPKNGVYFIFISLHIFVAPQVDFHIPVRYFILNALFNALDFIAFFKHSASLHIYAPLPFAFPIGSKNTDLFYFLLFLLTLF